MKKIALVHDDLVQWGGAERMLLGLSKVFPQADIFTSVIDPGNKLIRDSFIDKNIKASFIQKIPNIKVLYKALLPLYPIAFEQFDFTGYDVVISQTTRFAKSLITKPETLHICYCHTPPRFLYDFNEKKSGLRAIPRKTIEKPYFDWLKKYDKISSKRVDLWVAGSKNAQARIADIYGASSTVIYPYVDLVKEHVDIFNGGYLLVISRLNEYKRVDLVIKAASELGLPVKIVGRGDQLSYLRSIAPENVEFVQDLDDRILKKLIAGCLCLVVAGEEDFGLTPIEAQVIGKPVVAYGKGGALETVIDGKTGYLFEHQSIQSLKGSLLQLINQGYNEKACLDQAARFSFENFKQQWSTIF